MWTWKHVSTSMMSTVVSIGIDPLMCLLLPLFNTYSCFQETGITLTNFSNWIHPCQTFTDTVFSTKTKTSSFGKKGTLSMFFFFFQPFYLIYACICMVFSILTWNHLYTSGSIHNIYIYMLQSFRLREKKYKWRNTVF